MFVNKFYKMFKKSKKLNPPPKPITVEQILSDLETFAVPKSEVETTRLISPNDPDFENQWWKLFETFRDDVEQLHRLQNTLGETKEGLTERRKEIQETIEKLERKMNSERIEVIDGIVKE